MTIHSHPIAEPLLTAVIAHEHPLWLEAVEGLLARLGVEIVGKEDTWPTVLRRIEEERPDLLLTTSDVLDEAGGRYECLRVARERVPELKVIVFGDSRDPSEIETAFAAGAAAYVVKTAASEEIASAVRQAVKRSVHFPRHPAAAAVPRPSELLPEPRLTGRELEILRLVAEGRTNAQVAKVLWVTEQTVKFHLSNIYAKLGLSNRTEASRWAQLNGLLTKRD